MSPFRPSGDPRPQHFTCALHNVLSPCDYSWRKVCFYRLRLPTIDTVVDHQYGKVFGLPKWCARGSLLASLIHGGPQVLAVCVRAIILMAGTRSVVP